MEATNIFQDTDLTVTFSLSLDTLNKLAILAEDTKLDCIEEAIVLAVYYTLDGMHGPEAE